MKFTVRMKTPDALDEAIANALELELIGRAVEHEELAELRETMESVADKWFLYGEMVDLEIDTNAGTCKVVEW